MEAPTRMFPVEEIEHMPRLQLELCTLKIQLNIYSLKEMVNRFGDGSNNQVIRLLIY